MAFVWRVRIAILASFLMMMMAGVASAQGDRYIVQFRDDVSYDNFSGEFSDDSRVTAPGASTYHRRDVVGAAMSLERRYGFRATNFYSRAVKGFAAELTPAQVRALAAEPFVLTIERDVQLTLTPDVAPTQTVPWGIPKIHADVSTTHSGDGTGDVTGVTLYVVDTGIDVTHPDLNVVGHVSFAEGPNADCNGHGTGVAGIAAARDNDSYSVGVAPGLPVFGVKVLNCQGVGFTSVIVQGVDWVVANGVKPAVINMSLGSSISISSLNTAVRNAAAAGFVVAVAAGNGSPFTGIGVDACRTSPANAGYYFGYPNGVISTAATDVNDEEAVFSNYGRCVDIWAPGVDLSSTWLMSDGGMITASGTSFSSPYVAGAAALLLSRFPTLTPPLVEYVLRATAELPGTLSKDGAPIRRLSVRYF